MDELIERRYCLQHNLHITKRAEGDPPLFLGYAAVFNTLSVMMWGFREKIAPGAFTNSLGDDVRALWDHQTGWVMGRTKSGTLRLAEDATGLRFENDPPTTATREIESVQRGDVDQMSFGFSTLEDTWDIDENDQVIRTLLKVKLYEVSYVTFPAYPATTVGVRSGERAFDPALGVIPVIPQEFRRASDSYKPAEMEARARYLDRQRRLQLLGLE